MIIYNFILLLFFLFFYIYRKRIYNYYGIFDLPDKKRKTHHKTTSLSGGLLILLGIFGFYFQQIIFSENIYLNDKLIFTIKELNIFVFFSIIIFLIGFFDDKIDLSPLTKTIFIIIALFVFLRIEQTKIINEINFSFSHYKFWLEDFNIFFTIFCFFLFMNAFNLFDGIDLQSGAYAFILLLYMCLLITSLVYFLTLLLFIIFFLYLNFKKEIFLGNSGSLLLSFLISFFLIKIYNTNKFNLYSDQIFLLMILPGIDMLRLFVIRILNRKNPFSGDRFHLHHLLLNIFNQYQVFLIILLFYLFPIILIIFNISSVVILSIFLLIYICLIINLKSR